MLLSTSERILLLSILPPAEGSMLFLRSVRRLRESVSFTDEEIRDWKITSSGPGTFNWDASVAAPVEITIDGPVRQYVCECFKAADLAGRLHEHLIPVYDQLFPPEE